MNTSNINPNLREKYLDKDEINRLISTCREKANQDLLKGRQGGVRQWAVINSLLSTGLRVQELCNVNVFDFRPSKRLLKVRTLKQKKDKSKIDVIPLPSELVKHLKEYLKWKYQLGEDINKDKPLFTSKRGERYTRSAIQKLFKKVCKDAKLDPVYSVQSLRHTYAVALLEKTKNIREVQLNLRHSDIRITSSFYSDIPFSQRLNNVNNLYES